MKEKDVKKQEESVEKPIYESPSIEVIEVKVEQGFLASPGKDGGGSW